MILAMAKTTRNICMSQRSARRRPCRHDLIIRAFVIERNPLYNPPMSALRSVPLALVLTAVAAAQQSISFPSEDGGRVCAGLYGQSARAVVLAHGGRFNKE